jgi:hypothetical protein
MTVVLDKDVEGIVAEQAFEAWLMESVESPVTPLSCRLRRDPRANTEEAWCCGRMKLG